MHAAVPAEQGHPIASPAWDLELPSGGEVSGKERVTVRWRRAVRDSLVPLKKKTQHTLHERRKKGKKENWGGKRKNETEKKKK